MLTIIRILILVMMSNSLLGMEKFSSRKKKKLEGFETVEPLDVLVPLQAQDGVTDWPERHIKQSLLLREMYEKKEDLKVPNCTLAQLTFVKNALEYKNFHEEFDKLSLREQKELQGLSGVYDEKGQQTMLYIPLFTRHFADRLPNEIRKYIVQKDIPLDYPMEDILISDQSIKVQSIISKSVMYLDYQGRILRGPVLDDPEGFFKKLYPEAYSLKRYTDSCILNNQLWGSHACLPMSEDTSYIVTDFFSYSDPKYQHLVKKYRLWFHKKEKDGSENNKCTYILLNDPIKDIFFTPDRKYIVAYSAEEVGIIHNSKGYFLDTDQLTIPIPNIKSLYYNDTYEYLVIIAGNENNNKTISVWNMQGKLLFTEDLGIGAVSKGCFDYTHKKFFLWCYRGDHSALLTYDLVSLERCAHRRLVPQDEDFVERIHSSPLSDALVLITFYSKIIFKKGNFIKTVSVGIPHVYTHLIYNKDHDLWVGLFSVNQKPKYNSKTTLLKKGGSYISIFGGDAFDPYVECKKIASQASLAICMINDRNTISVNMDDSTWLNLNLIDFDIAHFMDYFDTEATLFQRYVLTDLYDIVHKTDEDIRNNREWIDSLLASLPERVRNVLLMYYPQLQEKGKKPSVMGKVVAFFKK